MNGRFSFFSLVLSACLFATPGSAVAQNAISAPASKTIGTAKTEMVPSLIVLNAPGAMQAGDDAVVADDFTFTNTTGASEVSLADLPDMDELPAQYSPGETK